MKNTICREIIFFTEKDIRFERLIYVHTQSVKRPHYYYYLVASEISSIPRKNQNEL